MKTGTKSSKIQSAFCYHTNSGKHTATTDDKTLLFALQDDGCLKVLNLKAGGVQPTMSPIIFSPRSVNIFDIINLVNIFMMWLFC